MMRQTAINLLLAVAVALQSMPGGNAAAENKQPTVRAPQMAVLEKAAVLGINPVSGSLKESRHASQELVWRTGNPNPVHAFRLTNVSVSLMAIRKQVSVTISANVSSHGYRTLEPLQLHVILRSRGGAALYTSVFGILVQCGDGEQTLHPRTENIPELVADTVFANVSWVDVTEHSEGAVRGLRVERCG